MLRDEFKRAYMREHRGRWWQLRRWVPAIARRVRERRMRSAFTRATWECDGMVFGHDLQFVRIFTPDLTRRIALFAQQMFAVNNAFRIQARELTLRWLDGLTSEFKR